jgi:hypothetical protein
LLSLLSLLRNKTQRYFDTSTALIHKESINHDYRLSNDCNLFHIKENQKAKEINPLLLIGLFFFVGLIIGFLDW